MLFQKKPWKDLKKYYVLASKDEHFEPLYHVSVTQGFEEVAKNRKEHLWKALTIEQGIKLTIKNNAKITICPEDMDSETYQWFIENCPREYWEFYTMSDFYRFN